MHVAIYCPFAVSLLLGLAAPGLARRLPPATATRLLTGSAVVAAASSCVALAVLAATLLGQLPPVVAAAHWSPAALAHGPVPRPVAALAAAALTVLALRGGRVAVRQARALLAARAFCRGCGAGGQLVVLDEEIETTAVPARDGRILVSRRGLAALPPAERRALLLHEGAHLAHRHHRYRLAAELAAAVDPLQRSLPAAVRFATERWADESAASAVGDRAVVARVLARSGLRAAARPRAPWAPVALRSGGPAVVDRVQALLAPAPRQRPWLVAAAAAVVAFGLTAALHAEADTDAWLDHAVVAAPAHAAGPPAAER